MRTMAAMMPPTTTAKKTRATINFHPRPLDAARSSLRHIKHSPFLPRAILCFLQMARVDLVPALVRLEGSSHRGTDSSLGRGLVSERFAGVALREGSFFLGPGESDA